MKKSISLISVLLSLSLALPLLVSCAAPGGKPADTGSSVITSDPSSSTEPVVTTSTPDPEPVTWDSDGVLRILTIGNSFSDDTMQYVYQIAKSAGVSKIELGNLYIGGCTLATHVNNAKNDSPAYEYRTNTRGSWSTAPNTKMSTALESKDWDFISMQQASGSSGVDRTYSGLSELIKYVRAHSNPDAVLVWNMTWAYQQNSTHSEFVNYKNDQLNMYNSILSAVAKKVDKSDISVVSPTGTAIQNARTSYVGDNLTRDGYHLTYDLGRYIAGLTFFSALTGISVENLEYAPDNFDAELKKIAIESATNAVAHPREITPSSFTKAPDLPEFNEDDYVRLDFEWTPLGYWNSTDGTNHHKIITSAGNSKQFFASKTFTKDDIPVGSIILLADGWQYRPEGWKSSGVQSGRPDNVTIKRVVVTDSWWGSYTERAFNLSKTGLPVLSADEPGIADALVIWVPKK